MHVVFKLLGALYQEPGRNCAAPLKMCAQAKRHYRLMSTSSAGSIPMGTQLSKHTVKLSIQTRSADRCWKLLRSQLFSLCYPPPPRAHMKVFFRSRVCM